MALLKRGSERRAPEAGPRKGRPLASYLLPVTLVALVVLAALGVLVHQTLAGARHSQSRERLEGAARILVSQVGEALRNRLQMLQLLAADGRVVRGLEAADPGDLEATATEVAAGLPGILQLRLLPRDWDRPDPGGAAPLGFAGLDLVRRAVATGRAPPAEVHQIRSGHPYLALAQPVHRDGAVVGVLFAAYDLRPFRRMLTALGSLPGQLRIEQVAGARPFALAETGEVAASDVYRSGALEIPGSIWRVSYAVARGPLFGNTSLSLLGSLGLAAVALLLAYLLQLRALRRDLRHDLGTAVALGEATLKGEGAATPGARIRELHDALLLLAQCAQSAFQARRRQEQARTASESAVRPPPAPVEVEELVADHPEAVSQAAVELPAEVFRAYDIRGRAGDQLTPDFARLLGRALGSLIQERGGQLVLVGRDARHSSEGLARALVEGLRSSGRDLVDLGQVPTPLLYYGVHALEADGGVMVTGSHNPPGDNGFKILLGEEVLAGEALQALAERMRTGPFTSGEGGYGERDLSDDYVARICGDVALARPLRLVVDGGNGVAGPLAVRLYEALGCEVQPLFCEPDGDFPNHHPDPSRPENLAALALEVQAQSADLGLAFDGDGDRVGLVDGAGRPVAADQLLMLLAADVLTRNPGADVIYDVKSSRHLAGFVLSHGGRPIMWRSGHSRLKAKMRETGALLGGEFAGHFFIKERWYGFDDGLYTGARLLEILSADPRPVGEVFAELPSSPATPELQMPLPPERVLPLMSALAAAADFPDARRIDLDGLRLEFGDGWGLVRASNTTASLIFRFEGDDQAALERIQGVFRELLARVAPELQPPF